MRFALGSCKGLPVRAERQNFVCTQCVWNAISQRTKTVNNNSFDVFILQQQQPLFAALAVAAQSRRNFYVIKVWVRERGCRVEVFAVVILFGTPAGEARWENAISLMAFALPSQHLLNFLYRWGFSHVTGTQRTGLYREGLILAIATRQTQFTRGPLFDFLSQLLIFKTTRTLTHAHLRHLTPPPQPPASTRASLFSGVLFKYNARESRRKLNCGKSFYCGKIAFKQQSVLCFYGWMLTPTKWRPCGAPRYLREVYNCVDGNVKCSIKLKKKMMSK